MIAALVGTSCCCRCRNYVYQKCLTSSSTLPCPKSTRNKYDLYSCCKAIFLQTDTAAASVAPVCTTIVIVISSEAAADAATPAAAPGSAAASVSEEKDFEP